MDNSRQRLSPDCEKFLAAILGEEWDGGTSTVAVERRRRRKAEHDAWLRAITGDDSISSDPFAADVLGEHNFNPNEPRDRYGRWTTGDSSDDWLHDITNSDPGTSGDPADDAARKELEDAKKKAEGGFKKGLDDLFKGADKAKKDLPWKSTQTGNNGKNADILRKNLEKGGTHFEKGEQAHHIVQSTDPRAKVARDLLDKYHIDINSADNGLKLTRQVHQTSGLQQTKTIDAVTKNLKDAADSAKDWGAARAKVLDALSKIKTGIANGKRLCP